jgi:TPR repeat protein
MAADQGDAAGKVEVGALYETGAGVPRDYAEAMRWYRKAADQVPDSELVVGGVAAGQRAVALLYARGLGVTADKDQARTWMKKAADQGDSEAQTWLTKNA